MEFLVARKVRSVFNIYREVFHKVHEAAKEQGNFEFLKRMFSGMIPVPTKPSELEDRVNANYAALRHKKELLGLSDESVAAISNRIDDNLGLSTHLDYLPLDERGVAKSATVLLRENGSGMSTQEFFKLLLANGIVEQKTHHGRNRDSRYYILTEKGLIYGKNDTNPDHPEKVQMHFYEHSFRNLMNATGA